LSHRAVWDAAEQKGLIRLLPRDEANSDQAFHQLLQMLTEQNFSAWNAVNDARRFELVDPDPTHLSPQQLAETIHSSYEQDPRGMAAAHRLTTELPVVWAA
jgi:allophanate hydrolase subunit 1